MSKVKRQTEKKNLSYLKQKINLFIQKEHLETNNNKKKTNNQTENEQRTYTGSLQKYTHMKICSASLITRERQIKPILTNYVSPARLVKLQSLTTYSIGKVMKNRCFQTLLEEMQNGTIPYGGQFGNINQNYNSTYI